MYAESGYAAASQRLGLRALHRRLARREAAVVRAVAEVDLDVRLVPEELRRFVSDRIEQERESWARGELASVWELFHGRPQEKDRCQVSSAAEPLARVVWAARDARDGGWRFVLLVGHQLCLEASSGRRIGNLDGKRWLGLRAFWTLVREGRGWRLIEVEADTTGSLHYVKDRLPVAVDEHELRDEATITLADAARAPAAGAVAQLAEADAPVRARLLDLSLVDGRYAPDAIAACVGEIVRAWEGVTEDGDAAELARWSGAEGVRDLTYPTPNGRRRVRNLELRSVRVASLDTDATPPRIAVEVELHGLRWLASIHGTHTPISGNDLHARSFTERWTLEAQADGEAPWRVVDVADPGRR